jgi:hypothetical protein
MSKHNSARNIVLRRALPAAVPNPISILWEKHVNIRCTKLLALMAAAIPVCAVAATTSDHLPRTDLQRIDLQRTELTSPVEITSGPSMTIPLIGWPVDVKTFLAQHKVASKGNLKAATDPATVYRPVPVCRLIDTRGNPAFFTLAGPLLAGSTTNVPAAGRCGIPGTGVAGLSISFHILNLTVNNGGTIAFLEQGAPPNGVNAVFNPGAMWTAATANISIPDDSGNFAIVLSQSNIQLIVDVNGYYQDLDNVDVGTQELDIVGNGPGDTFEVSNLGSGSALSGSNFGGGPGVRINSGSFAVAGAGIGSDTTAFVLEVNTAGTFGAGGNVCGGQSSIAVIDHPMLNNDSSAIVLLTPRENAPSSVGSAAPLLTGGPFTAFFVGAAACSPSAANHWAVRDTSGAALPNHGQFSVLIIKTQ